MRLHTATITLAALTFLASGCGPTRSQASLALEQRTGGAIDEGWSVALSKDRVGWQLFAPKGSCVVLMSRGKPGKLIKAHKPTREFRCYNPETGALDWQYTHEVPQGFVQDRVFFTEDRLVYVSQTEGIGLDLDSGALVWTFDPGKRPIHNAFVAQDLLVVDLEHEVLAVLDAVDGTWLRGIALNNATLDGVVTGGEALLAIMVTTYSAENNIKRASMQAISVLGPGGDAPRAPWATEEALWKLDVTARSRGLRVIDGLLVGFWENGELGTLDPVTGKSIQQEPLDMRTGKPAKKPKRRRKQTVTRAQTPNELVQRSKITKLPPLGDLKANRLVLSDGTSILTQGPQAGVVLTFLKINAFDPNDLQHKWTASLPWRDMFRFKQEIPELNALFVANLRQAALLDLDSGRVLWSGEQEDGKKAWSNAQTDGRALYTLYNNRTQFHLEARPIP